MFSGFFDVYDEKCSGPTPTGIHSMEMVATVVQILNSIHYIPGITVGELKIHDQYQVVTDDFRFWEWGLSICLPIQSFNIYSPCKSSPKLMWLCYSC